MVAINDKREEGEGEEDLFIHRWERKASERLSKSSRVLQSRFVDSALVDARVGLDVDDGGAKRQGAMSEMHIGLSG